MPDFNTEIDIDPWEYVSECSPSEIKELIEILIEDGHLDQYNGKVQKNHEMVWVSQWKELIEKLNESHHLLSIEDENIIINIIKKLP